MWRHGCPKSLEWVSSCSACETSLGCELYEHNNQCRAIEVVGQDWSSEVVALFLEDWELGRVALSCHMTVDLLCQEMRDALGYLRVAGFPLFTVFAVSGRVLLRKSERIGCLERSTVTANNPFSNRGQAVTLNKKDVVRENTEKRSASDKSKFSKNLTVRCLKALFAYF